MLHRICRFSLSIIVYCLVCVSGSVVAAGEPLILAVHPYLPVPEIQARFAPLTDYLTSELGRPVSIRVGGDYEEHINAIGTDKVDIAFMGPASYINLVRQFGAKPLLARFEVNNEPYLYGVIATRQESSLDNLRQLKEAHFAFGDPESTMSHLVPRYMLMQAGIVNGLPADYQYLGSHKNVALGVLAGDFDAGAMKKEVFDEFEAKGLRALAISPGVPDHLFVTRADMPEADIKLLRQALLRLKDRDNGIAILHKIHKGLTAFIPASDSDYEELRIIIQTVESETR